MKKKIKKLVIIFSLVFIIFSLCSFQKNNIITVKGIISVYGNEPFTFIGLRTKDKKEFTIYADENVEKELRQVQGQNIEITGLYIKSDPDKVELNMLKDGKIELTEWKFVD